jgi:predicted transcriptional regulator
MRRDTAPRGHAGASVTGPQLRRQIKSAGLTIRQAAALLGMQERQLYRYLSGETEVPRVVEFALNWVIQEKPKV